MAFVGFNTNIRK